MATPAITSILSSGQKGHLDIEDHEVNLEAITSNPLGLGDVGTALSSDQKFLILKRLDLNNLVTLDDLPLTATFMIEKIEQLSIDEALRILKETVIEHDNDVNIPVAEFDLYESLIRLAPQDLKVEVQHETIVSEKEDKSVDEKENDINVRAESASSVDESSVYSPYEIVDWNLQTRLEAGLIAYHSPYQEVRAVTDPYDDPTQYAETLRVYVLGLIWTCIASFVNEFFHDRQPSVTFLGGVVQMFLYPCGVLWAKIIPNYTIKIWKYRIPLNPGPWTYKEQILAGLMFSLGGQAPYVDSNITVQKLKIWFDNDWVDMGYQVLLLLSTNFMGLGVAGILRKFVIYPSNAVWPSILPNLALNRALLSPEKKENINGWTISRYRFFFVVAASSFVYFWVPDYLFQALSIFNWMTWIAPDNFNLANITGSSLGLGLNPIPSFDWNVIGTNALTFPFYTTMNQYIGSFIAFFAIIGVYYSNYKWTANIPINSNRLFNNVGELYDVKQVINERSTFDQAKYDVYGPPFYTAANLVVYGSYFALYPFIIFHEVAMTWRQLLKSFKGFFTSLKHIGCSNFEDFHDPHSTMMRKYKEVPDWVFLAVLVISIVLAILCAELYPAGTPVWSIFFVVALNLVFLVPISTLFATTGFSFGLNVISELIIGYAIPGNGLALNFIKALGYNIDGQAQQYIADQKMGHYAKVPPRAMFRVQVLGLFVGTFVSLGALNFKLDHFENYCEPHQKDKFTCPNTGIFFSSSVIWGIIGPAKVFGGLYPVLQWCFLIGFLLAIPCILLKLYGPKRYLKYFQPSIIIGGMQQWAPSNLYYQTGAVYLSVAFMWYVKSRYSAFWNKYNYVFNSAMQAGVAFSSVIIFFAVQYHNKSITWWGNTVPFAGIDGGNGRQTLMNATLNEGGYFGPRVGHFP